MNKMQASADDLEIMLFHYGVKEFLFKKIDEKMHFVFTVRWPDWQALRKSPYSKEYQEFFVVEKVTGLGAPGESSEILFKPRNREEYNLLLTMPANKMEDAITNIRETRNLSRDCDRPPKKVVTQVNDKNKPKPTEAPVVVPDIKKGEYGLLDQGGKSGDAGSFFDDVLLSKEENEFTCLPLRRKSEVPRNMHSDSKSEHPAIPGLWLSTEEMLYKFYLEIRNRDGWERMETALEKHKRLNTPEVVSP